MVYVKSSPFMAELFRLVNIIIYQVIYIYICIYLWVNYGYEALCKWDDPNQVPLGNQASWKSLINMGCLYFGKSSNNGGFGEYDWGETTNKRDSFPEQEHTRLSNYEILDIFGDWILGNSPLVIKHGN